MIIEIEQVIATHRHEWRKWPDTDDRDYRPIFDERFSWVFIHGEKVIRVKNRFYPVYSSYLSAKDEKLPLRFPVINNLTPPSTAVLEQQRKDLQQMAKSCRSILWEHAHQCFPEVVLDQSELFDLRILSHGDDCPGSSDVKTFPVASFFNILVHAMLVWDNESGAMTADEYKRRGVDYTRFCPSAMSIGLDEGLRNLNFSIDKKQEMIRRGEAAPHLAFVGFTGGGERAQLFRALSALHARKEQLGLSMKLHGINMPDGPLEPRDPPHPNGLGYPMAPLYASAFASPNIPISSLFNCRLADLWFSGVLQFARDRWGELSKMGFVDGEHFVSFNGTADDLLAKIEAMRSTPEVAAEMAGRAFVKATKFWQMNSWTAAYTDVYSRFVDGKK